MASLFLFQAPKCPYMALLVSWIVRSISSFQTAYGHSSSGMHLLVPHLYNCLGWWLSGGYVHSFPWSRNRNCCSWKSFPGPIFGTCSPLSGGQVSHSFEARGYSPCFIACQAWNIQICQSPPWSFAPQLSSPSLCTSFHSILTFQASCFSCYSDGWCS